MQGRHRRHWVGEAALGRKRLTPLWSPICVHTSSTIRAVGASWFDWLANQGGRRRNRAYVMNAAKVRLTNRTRNGESGGYANFHRIAATIRDTKKWERYTPNATTSYQCSRPG